MTTGCFLGGEVDPATGQRTEERFGFDLDDLTTHGIIVGMTGSGKTGLGIGLLEELILAGVPIIAIDPKGDLSNLGLVFPDQSPADFAPWVDAAEAKRAGVSEQEHAETVAQEWRAGLADWGLGGEQLSKLDERLRLQVFTPGSDAGVSVDLLGRLGRPSEAIMSDSGAARDLLVGTVTALLSLVGVDADPVRSPEHVVLSHILDSAWRTGDTLTLETLIMRLVDPPFSKVGVFPLDTFFAPDDRMALAMRLNGLVASPAFEPWTKGEPLDVDAMLDTRAGTVPVSVFHLAHLDDEQRMFFVSMLLERVLAWTRTQPGTSSLRAVIYFDEVVGYLPPHPKNPPSKAPLLTLMKQARAMGLGVVLSTQNPVDLDYKAFSNAGLWMVGRLQTKQDRERVAQGLMNAQAGMDRATLNQWFDRLAKRVFLCQNTHGDGPVLFSTRWAMSYLRGPLTAGEISKLDTAEARPALAAAVTVEAPPVAAPIGAEFTPIPPPAPGKIDAGYLDPRVVFSARMNGLFEATEEQSPDGGQVVFRPALYAQFSLTFDEARGGFLAEEVHHRVYFPLSDDVESTPINAPFERGDVLTKAPAGGWFSALPDHLDESSEFAAVQRSLLEDVYRNESRGQWINAPLKLHGRAEETREEFDARVSLSISDRGDIKVAKLRDRYEREVDKFNDRIARKRDRLSELELAASGREQEELVNAGELVLSFFVGRRRSMGTVASKHRQTAAAEQRVASAANTLADLEDRLADMVLSLQDDVDKIRETEQKLFEKTVQKDVRLERTDIRLEWFGLLWVPVTRRTVHSI